MSLNKLINRQLSNILVNYGLHINTGRPSVMNFVKESEIFNSMYIVTPVAIIT